MKFFFDFLPIIIFFIVYKWVGFFAATASAISIALVQLLYLWFKNKKVDNLQLMTVVILLALGVPTLLLHNEMFFKLKPTAIYWVFSLIFFLSHFFGKKTITERLLDQKIDLPVIVWFRLNISWVIFFFLLGVINLYVVYNFTTNAWVNFKLFGILGLTILFIVIQGVYLAKHVKEKE